MLAFKTLARVKKVLYLCLKILAPNMSVSKFSALIPSLQKISLTRVEGYVHAKTDYDQSMGSFLSKEPLDDAFEPEK